MSQQDVSAARKDAHCVGAYTPRGFITETCRECARYALFRELLDGGRLRILHPYVVPSKADCRHFIPAPKPKPKPRRAKKAKTA